MNTSISKRQTNDTLKNDTYDILQRDSNVGGVIRYTEHLLPTLAPRPRPGAYGAGHTRIMR